STRDWSSDVCSSDLERIAATAKAMLDADRATLYVVDQGRNEIWSRVLTEGEVPEGVEPVREIRLPLDGRSLAAEVARTGHVLRKIGRASCRETGEVS